MADRKMTATEVALQEQVRRNYGNKALEQAMQASQDQHRRNLDALAQQQQMQGMANQQQQAIRDQTLLNQQMANQSGYGGNFGQGSFDQLMQSQNSLSPQVQQQFDEYQRNLLDGGRITQEQFDQLQGSGAPEDDVKSSPDLSADNVKRIREMANISPVGIISFPHLFDPRPRAPGGDPVFSCAVIFDEEAQKTPEYKTMKQLVLTAAREKFGDQADDMIKKGKLRLPFRDAGEKDYAGYENGYIFINPWSKQAPGVIDGRLQDMVPTDVWAGQKVRVSYNPFAYDTAGNKGVSFGLNNVQVVKKDMPRIDGRVAAAAEFDAMDSDNGDDDDEIPF